MVFQVRVVRQGTEQSEASETDPGVLAVVAVLDPVLGDAPPDDLVLESIRNALNASFSSVQETAQGMRYGWVSNPAPPPALIWVCDDSTQFAVDDGGAAPVLVALTVSAF